MSEFFKPVNSWDPNGFMKREVGIRVDQELAAIELRLSVLEKEKADLLSRKEELYSSAHRCAIPPVTPGQKVDVFRKLFVADKMSMQIAAEFWRPFRLCCRLCE